jgi:YfiH family protein
MIDLYRFKKLEDETGCIHGVTMKREGALCSFSQALHTGESEEDILSNREAVAAHFQVRMPLYFVLADQTHSDNIHLVTAKETKGWESLESAIADCDALVTDQKGVMLGVLTADCVPILIYDPVRGVVAVVHAGWRGTKAQIAAKTVGKMQEVYGCDPADIIAGIAPAIGQCCYEVGEEVAKHFFDMPKGYIPRGEKYMLDLPFINKTQLMGAGLKEEHIELSGICTACEIERFFSYRKEQGCSGRFMSLIGIMNNE